MNVLLRILFGLVLVICVLFALAFAMSSYYTAVTEQERQAALEKIGLTDVLEVDKGSKSNKEGEDVSSPVAREAYAHLIESLKAAHMKECNPDIEAIYDWYWEGGELQGLERTVMEGRQEILGIHLANNVGLLNEIHATLALPGIPSLNYAEMDWETYADSAICLSGAAWWLCLDAVYRMKALGDVSGAVRDYRSIIRLGQVFSAYPAYSLWHSEDNCKWLLGGYPRIFSNRQPSDSVMAELLAQLAVIRKNTVLSKELKGNLRLILGRRKQWTKESWREQAARCSWYRGTRSWIWTRPICRPFFNQDELVLLSFSGELLQAIQGTYTEYFPELCRIFDEVKALPSFRYYHLSSQFLVQFDSILQQVHCKVMLDLLRIGIAAERYRVANGGYPPDLESLTELFEGEMPKNPYDGTSYTYQLTGEKFLLYGRVPERVFWYRKRAGRESRAPAPTMQEFFEEDTAQSASAFDLIEVPLQEDEELWVWCENVWWRVVGNQIGDAARWQPRPEPTAEAGSEI